MSARIGGSSTHLPQAAGMLPSRKQRSSSVWHSRLELAGCLGRQAGDGLRYVGQVRPQPPGERFAPGRRRGHRTAAQHHQVVRLLRVEPGQQLDGGRGPHRTRPFDPFDPFEPFEALEQMLLERPPHRNAGFGQQRCDQPAGADRRLEHQRHRATGPGQRLSHGLQPDGRTVDQVQVDVAVDECPRGQGRYSLTA
jgi:hypothetical protein